MGEIFEKFFYVREFLRNLFFHFVCDLSFENINTRGKRFGNHLQYGENGHEYSRLSDVRECLPRKFIDYSGASCKFLRNTPSKRA